MISMELSQAASHINGTLLGKDTVFTGCSTDSRSDNIGKLFIAIEGDKFDGHEFINKAVENGAIGSIVSKDVDGQSRPCVLVENTIQAMGELAAYWRSKFDIPLIAITGSNGKTTVKEMVFSVLSEESTVLSTKGNLNNHIGVPLTIFNLGDEHKYAVVEMGANHPGEISRLTKITKPTVATITTCAPSHLEGFGSVEGVANAKAEIYEGLQNGGTAVINIDEDYADLWKKCAGAHERITFSTERDADIYANSIELSGECLHYRFILYTPNGDTSVQLPVPGRHNVQNAVAAAACCYSVGIPLASIKNGLEGLRPVNNRLQLKVNTDGVNIYDDTYNANPKSLEVAMQTISEYPGRHWLVLGDMGELGRDTKTYHEEAGDKARALGFERLFAIGPNSYYAAEKFGSGGSHYSTIQELINSIRNGLTSNIRILVKGSRYMKMERVINALVEDS